MAEAVATAATNGSNHSRRPGALRRATIQARTGPAAREPSAKAVKLRREALAESPSSVCMQNGIQSMTTAKLA